MIKRLAVDHWRNFADLDITLNSGVTFVVAPNGVGKTSLIEAARYGLYGIVDSPETAVQVGQPSAKVQIELELPSGRIVEVTRELPSKLKARQHFPAPEVRLDGAPFIPEQFQELLTTEYAAETGFLARLTMPASDTDDAPASMGLEEHLGQYFGIDGLRTLLTRLNAELKECESAARKLKLDNAASAKRLDEFSAQVQAARSAVEVATATHAAAAKTTDRVRVLVRAREALQSWEAAAAQRSESMKALVAEATTTLGSPVPPERVEEAVSDALSAAAQEMNELRVALGLNESKTDSLKANRHRLEQAEGDCPVCRRPLDEHTVSLATQEIDHDIQLLSTSATELLGRREALHERESRLLILQQELLAHPALPPRPAIEEDRAEVLPELSDAEEAQQSSLDALVVSRAQLSRSLEQQQAAQDAGEAMSRLKSLLRREATIRIAIETTRRTLREVLDQAVRPLTAEINVRWTALFPDRGAIETPSDGAVTREIDGHLLPFEAFSDGESSGLKLLIRVLVAQMASKADFCWFDEPLEHLDPDTRRQVANILTRATSDDSQIQQIVVTTYEEPLARQLHKRDPDRVHLEDVRQ